MVKLQYTSIAKVAVRRHWRSSYLARLAVTRLVNMTPLVEEAFFIIITCVADGLLLIVVSFWIDEARIFTGNKEHEKLCQNSKS